MTIELLLFILFIAAELFEMLWQKSQTLLQMLEKIYSYYQRSPYLLYLMHPSYIFSLYLLFISDFSLWIAAIVAIKSLDIVFKILLIHKHFVQHELSEEMELILAQRLHPFILSAGLFFYPFLLFQALF
ncbi:MAG: hypothetical protein IBX43_06385 [Campylobacterales bacterium]|nr:hypothetical protein [Campylobacterales bacterium]